MAAHSQPFPPDSPKRFRPAPEADPDSGWTKTPHSYFTHLQRRCTFVEYKIVGLVLDRTLGGKGRPEWVQLTELEFAQHSDATVEGVHKCLQRLCTPLPGEDLADVLPIGVLEVRKVGRKREYRVVVDAFAAAEPRSPRKVEKKPPQSEGVDDGPAPRLVVMPGAASKPFVFPVRVPQVTHVNMTPYPLVFEYDRVDGIPLFRAFLDDGYQASSTGIDKLTPFPATKVKNKVTEKESGSLQAFLEELAPLALFTPKLKKLVSPQLLRDISQELGATPISFFRDCVLEIHEQNPRKITSFQLLKHLAKEARTSYAKQGSKNAAPSVKASHRAAEYDRARSSETQRFIQKLRGDWGRMDTGERAMARLAHPGAFEDLPE